MDQCKVTQDAPELIVINDMQPIKENVDTQGAVGPILKNETQIIDLGDDGGNGSKPSKFPRLDRTIDDTMDIFEVLNSEDEEERDVADFINCNFI